MRQTICFMLALALLATAFSVTYARGAPPGKQKAVTQAITVQAQAPIMVESVPPLTTGYDVICNLSTNQLVADTSASLRLSTTVAKRSINAGSYWSNSRLQPLIVLLA